MAGIKRKSASGKDGHVKEIKKAKTDAGVKKVSKSKKPAKAPVKKAESSDEDEDDMDVDEDSDMDGGVPLEGGAAESEELEEDEGPNIEDGLHPDRVKAVVASSEYYELCQEYILTLV